MYKKRWFFGLVLPALIIFTLIVLIPTIMSIGYSFTDWNRENPNASLAFVGFKNFANAFKSNGFLERIGYTVLFAIINLVLVNLLALGLAYILNKTFIRGRNILRSIYFIPNLISGILIGYIWKRMFNQLLPEIFPSVTEYLNGKNFTTATPTSALFAMSIVYTWQMTGYIMVIYIAALQNVNKTLEEAAAIEGAGKWQTFKAVVFPALAPALTIAFFLVLSGSFKMFDLNYAITDVAKRDYRLIAVDIFQTGQIEKFYAISQAKSVIFIILVSFLSFVQVYISKKFEVET